MKKYNFNAGPSLLTDVVLEAAAKAIIDFNGTGLSLLSISHRTPDFEQVLAEAQSLFRELLNIPDNYKIYFVGGGASTQFFHIPAGYCYIVFPEDAHAPMVHLDQPMTERKIIVKLKV